MKKQLIILGAFTLISTLANAGAPCAEPRPNVEAQIYNVNISEIGTNFCFAHEFDLDRNYEVMDCGSLKEGEIVTGTVYTYWTHKDAKGNPVCDYQNFVPDRLE